MKKQYINPTIEIINLNQQDIITGSFGTTLPGDTDYNYGEY